MKTLAQRLRDDADTYGNGEDDLQWQAADELEANDALIAELVVSLQECIDCLFGENGDDMPSGAIADRAILTLSKAKLNTPNDTGV